MFLSKFLFSSLMCCALVLSIHAQWVKQNVNTTSSLRGLSVVNEKVAWASGTGGTVIRTIDGGKYWNVVEVPGADKLDFRDIEAFDASTAYILSIGNGENSRIYKTTDGGKTWKLQFTNKNEKAFYDAIACWDQKHCIAVSDPIDRKFQLLRTENGEVWNPVGEGLLLRNRKISVSADGEAAFAASGTCLIAFEKTRAFLVSGGAEAQVYHSWNRGNEWFAYDTPMTKGTPGSGIFSIATRDDKLNVIVGGNYEKPAEAISNLAFSSDLGRNWTLGTGLKGYRSAVVYVDETTIIAVGTNGSDISTDGGKIWRSLDRENYNSVQAKGRGSIWAVGPNGRVAKLLFEK